MDRDRYSDNGKHEKGKTHKTAYAQNFNIFIMSPSELCPFCWFLCVRVCTRDEATKNKNEKALYKIKYEYHLINLLCIDLWLETISNIYIIFLFSSLRFASILFVSLHSRSIDRASDLMLTIGKIEAWHVTFFPQKPNKADYKWSVYVKNERLRQIKSGSVNGKKRERNVRISKSFRWTTNTGGICIWSIGIWTEMRSQHLISTCAPIRSVLPHYATQLTE